MTSNAFWEFCEMETTLSMPMDFIWVMASGGIALPVILVMSSSEQDSRLEKYILPVMVTDWFCGIILTSDRIVAEKFRLVPKAFDMAALIAGERPGPSICAWTSPVQRVVRARIERYFFIKFGRLSADSTAGGFQSPAPFLPVDPSLR